MGYDRIPGLNFDLAYLKSEIRRFGEFINDPEWLNADTVARRQETIKGLTFVMLNLADEVDRNLAWELYHCVMDEYHRRCDQLHILY